MNAVTVGHQPIVVAAGGRPTTRHIADPEPPTELSADIFRPTVVLDSDTLTGDSAEILLKSEERVNRDDVISFLVEKLTSACSCPVHKGEKVSALLEKAGLEDPIGLLIQSPKGNPIGTGTPAPLSKR